MCEILKALREPWPHSEIKFRVGSTTKDKKKGLPLAYVDARAVMDRLDRVLGATNWQDRYAFPGARIVCSLSLRIAGEWITKEDGAGDSDVEAEKGGISDAFKRASTKWGMNRDLYDMKFQWMPIDDFKKLIGDPWKFLIKSDKAEPKFDLELEYKLCCDQINFAPTKQQFATMWNSPESKNRRGQIKALNEIYYADLMARKDLLLENFK